MKLVKMLNGNFKLVLDSGSILEGDRALVARHMWEELEVGEDEIEFAIAELERTEMDTAHFGIQGTFIYCSNSTLVKNVLAELKAVQSLRQEFAEIYRGNPNDLYVHDTGTRLLNLYIALNVDAMVQVLESPDNKNVA